MRLGQRALGLILQTAEVLDILDQRNATLEGEIEQQIGALRATKLETRRCPASDAELKLGSRYCSKFEVVVEASCRGCGDLLLESDIYCAICGEITR